MHILKTGKKKGQKKVYKKDIEAKYGTQAKTVSIKQTDINPGLLEKYRADHSKPTPAMSHFELAQAQDSEPPDWDSLLRGVTDIKPGKKEAYTYEDKITELLTALFYPVLVDPETQTPIHDGLKRVDITFTNYARSGFFEWLARHYSCAHIFVECKNFGAEIGNPEIDQIAMRFSKARGQFGMVICRTVEKRKRMQQRCKAAAQDGHGYVLVLDDDDLRELVDEASERLLQTCEFPSLKQAFDKLIM